MISFISPLSGNISAGQVIADNGTVSFLATSPLDPIRGIALADGVEGEKVPFASIEDDVRAIVGAVAVSVGDQLTTDSNGCVIPSTTFVAGAFILGECTRPAIAGGACVLRLTPHKTYAAGTGDTTLGVWRTNASSSTSYGLTAGALQSAVAAAVANDTILVNMGNYAGPIAIPDGVEIVGNFTDALITNTTTTDTVTMGAATALKGLQVQGPIAGGSAAVAAVHTSSMARIIEVIVLGNGGSHGIRLASGPLGFTYVKDCRFRGTLTGDFVRAESGTSVLDSVSYDTGQIDNFINCVGGIHSGSHLNASPAWIHP